MLGVEALGQDLVEHKHSGCIISIPESIHKLERVFVVKDIEVPDYVFIVDFSAAESHGLVEDGEGVAHCTVGLLGYDVQTFIVDAYALLRGNVAQFPEHQLFEETVLKDIMFGPMNFGVSEELAEKRARELITLVGLPESVLEKSPFDLSGGQMRRVAIAGVLAIEPEVIVLDEPTAGLDPRGQKEIMDLFYDLHQKRGLTTILVTHSMEDAARYADKIAIMNEGRCVLTGEPHELFADVETLASYRLEPPRVVRFQKEAEIPKVGLKHLEVIQKRYEILSLRVEQEKSAYSSLQEELQEITDELERIAEEQENFSNKLKNLRIDENKARADLEQLKRLLQNTERLLTRANIPGIPEEMDARLEEAAERIYVVVQSLQEVPLNIIQVNQHLLSAKQCIEETHDKAQEMIENVLIIERLIQYGNRYRATNRQVNEHLLEAEDAFKKFRYVKALEDAAKAVQMVDSQAIKRIEALVQEQLLVKS